jgi:hypothetical protein
MPSTFSGLRARKLGDTTMEVTLFGVIETKTETRDRAKRLAELYASLRDAPGAIACRQEQTMDLQYFIDRSRKRRMGPNDWDSLYRLIGDPEELLTDRERAAHRRNPKNWRRYKYGWLNQPPGQKWPCCMHPKEIAYLVGQRDELKGEIEAIEENVPRIREDVRILREIGPLPKDVADRYGLTEAGEPKPREEQDGKAS